MCHMIRMSCSIEDVFLDLDCYKFFNFGVPRLFTYLRREKILNEQFDD
jgi:hypothetical protein